MFKIYDGRENFYQWDTERKLIVSDASIKEVHFSDVIESVALVCEVYELDGLLVVDVPNVLLQTEWRINVYAFTDKHTKVGTTYKVLPRSKPSDYVYTETEVKSYEDLEGRLTALEENGGGIREITEETYITDLEPGIYKINATDDSFCIYMDDCYWIALYEGIVSFGYSEYENMYSWHYIGRDMNNGTTAHFGKTYWNGEFWICDDYRDIYNDFEYSNNRINNFEKASYSNYPSAKAVVDYINSKLVPIDLDVGGAHTDNEYYNANVVDAVLVEVVGLVEGMSEQMETMASGLDALTMRVEALEG